MLFAISKNSEPRSSSDDRSCIYTQGPSAPFQSHPSSAGWNLQFARVDTASTRSDTYLQHPTDGIAEIAREHSAHLRIVRLRSTWRRPRAIFRAESNSDHAAPQHRKIESHR